MSREHPEVQCGGGVKVVVDVTLAISDTSVHP